MKILVEKSKRRDGVALLIVLGMLALLLVMAATFSVTMRTERLGAGNYANNVSGRQLVQAALADAIERLDAEMVDGTNASGESSSSIYPEWDMIVSSNNLGRPISGSSLAWGEALEHIPGIYRRDAMMAKSDWLQAGTTNYGGTLVGRRAYLIINCSGLLDANFAGSEDRTNGTSTFELQLDNLPEFATNDINTFYADCLTHQRYESVSELVNLNLALNNMVGTTNAFHFMVNSLFPKTLLNTQVDLGDGSVSYIESKRNDIKDKFGVLVDTTSSDEKDFLYNNLLDYIDTDNKPRDLASPCTELVPMLNEVMVTGRVDFAMHSGTPVMAAMMETRAEWAFPFIKASSDNFKIERKIYDGTVKLGGAVVFTIPTVTTSYATGYQKDRDINKFHVVTDMATDKIKFMVNPVVTNSTYTIEFKMKFRIKNSTGKIVDEVPSPYTDEGFVYKTDVYVPGTPTSHLSFKGECWEAFDPRYNWDTSQPAGTWYPLSGRPLPGWNSGPWPSDTLNKTNAAASWIFDVWAPKSDHLYPVDQDMSMYVSDAGKLFSVAELGHLLRMKDYSTFSFYQTIRLFDLPDLNRVADEINKNFKLGEKSERGLVNINTDVSNVLYTAFDNMPKGYPDSGYFPSPADVDSIYTNISDYIWINGPFTTLDDLGRLDWRKILPDWNDVELDSMFAMTSGLLGTRQNLFTIILAAGPYSQSMGLGATSGNWLSTQRAVAVVWRDPTPTIKSKQYKVLYFKWVE